MDLRTFIADTLTQIVGGVLDAQRQIEELGSNASVNPSKVHENSRHKRTEPSPVEFDVALTVVERSSATNEEGIQSKQGMISVVHSATSTSSGASREEDSSEEAVSRIRFTVMLSQPGDIEVRPAFKQGTAVVY